MLFLRKDGSVIDPYGKVLGFIIEDRLVQSIGNKECDDEYKNGLSAMELERVSELIQNSK